MTYDEHLAALDRKLGRVVTVADWRALGTKSIEQLTDDDLEILHAFESPASWLATKEARDRGRTPSPPTVPVETKTAEPATMTETELDAIIRGIVPVVREIVTKATAEASTRLALLEQEHAALKATAFLKDAGVWRHGTTYQIGDVAQFSGSAWVCTKAHNASGPVADHACWRLWIKRGKDGRDLR